MMAATTEIQNETVEVKTIQDFSHIRKIPCLKFLCEKDTNKKDEDGNPKKKINALPAAWQTYDYDKCLNENKKSKALTYNCYNLNIRGSTYTAEDGEKYALCVIDVDKEEAVNDAFDKFGNTHFTQSCSKNLPHLWRRVPIEFANMKDDNNKPRGYDIRFTNVFETPDSELHDWTGDPPIYYPEKKVAKKEVVSTKKYDPEKVSAYDRALLDNINVIDYLEPFEHWRPIMLAIRKVKNNLLLADEYSKKSSNYSGMEDLIAKTSDVFSSKITWGTIHYYSKLSNPEKYKQIKAKYDFKIDLSDAGVADMLLILHSDDFVFQDSILYYCFASNPFWRYDDDDFGVRHKIKTDLLEFYNDRLEELTYNMNIINRDIALLEKVIEKDRDTNKIDILDGQLHNFKVDRDTIEKGILHAKTNNRLSNYVISLKTALGMPANRIMFDTLRPNVFCFQNCNIDVKIREKVEIYKHDYITKRVDYDYVKSTPEDFDELKQIIERILSEPEVRKCYMSVLLCGMLGQQIEKFVIGTGGGRNGKGVMNELFAALLTKVYFYTGGVTLITENLKGGANQEVANMDTKRTILFSEPNDSLKLKLSTIKNLTGSTEVVGRALYSKKTEVLLQNTTILECNTIPGIEGEIDTSAAERFIIIDFTATFTNDKKVLELKKNCFPLDTRYKTDAFKQKFKCVLFDYLLSFEFTELYLPDVVRERTNRYLVGCDDFLTFFNENYKFTDSDKDLVKLKDLHEKFRQSDMWESMPKADRRSKWSKGKMITFIKRNITLGLYYKDRYQKYELNERNVLTNYRLRDIVDVEE